MKRRLQIFVSSTYKDLMVERQAAVSAILKAGHIPAGMELFTAGDRSQMDTIKQWIDESDVYMLILGGRYGSVEESTKIGYTELEYDYAVQNSKPLFAVVITEDALTKKIQIEGVACMERDYPKELASFRAKVLSNISSFYDDSKDIKLCVHESLADFAANRDLKGWVPADAVVDTKPLFDEIAKLSDENRQLKEELSAMEKRAKQPISVNAPNTNLVDLEKILRAIEVEIPPQVMPEGEQQRKLDLLNLFYGNKESFIRGVTNAGGVNAVESFYYFSVCPKLEVHGVMRNEKVTGVRYRRYAVTQLGYDLLAVLDRRVHLEKTLVKAPAVN